MKSPQERLVAALCSCYYDSALSRFVVEYGEPFDPNPLPSGIAEGKPKCCFANAFRLASETGLAYYEGFGVLDDAPNTPKAHAWCADEDGKVVDPTWEIVAAEPEAYRGLELPLEFAEAEAYDFSRGTLDAWDQGIDELVKRLQLTAR